jgi:hypothetical protein
MQPETAAPNAVVCGKAIAHEAVADKAAPLL